MAEGYGAFGKMPALGDFFRLNLAPGFVDAWDRWLQSALSDARDRLGPAFESAYMTAPVWRFTLPAGVAGASAMCGVLMASVDRVGRKFPLTLAAPDGSARDGFARHAGFAAVAPALEEVALDALDDGMTRDGLAARLAGCPLPLADAPPIPVADRCLRLDSAGRVHAVEPGHLVAGPATTLWSALGGNLTLLAAEGLPPTLLAVLIAPGTVVQNGALHG